MVELVKKPRNATPTVEQLTADRDRAIELQLVMSGKFDAQIAELKAKQVELEPLLQIAATLESADNLRAAAESYAAGVREQADAEIAAALDSKAAAERMVSEATAKAASITEDAEEQARAILVTARGQADDTLSAGERELAAVREEIAEAQAKLADIATATETAQTALDELNSRLAERKADIKRVLGL